MCAGGRILWMHAEFQPTVRAFKYRKNKVRMYMCQDGHEDGAMNGLGTDGTDGARRRCLTEE